MKKEIITKEIFLMRSDKSKSISRSIVVDIENDIVTMSIREKNDTYPLVLNKNSKYVPIEINTQKPIESIEIKFHMIYGRLKYYEHEVKIYSKDFSTRRNQTYIHRDIIIPPYLKGKISISPLRILSVNYKDGDLLTKDESTKFEFLLIRN